MASISDRPDGTRRVQFTGPDRKRRTLYLGPIPKRAAEEMRGLVERLNAAALVGSAPTDADARALARMGDAMHGKLAGVGLVDARDPAPTLGQLTGAFLAARRPEVKPGTFAHLEDACEHLRDHFGDGRRVESVTPADADAFRAAFAAGGRNADGRAEASVRRMIGRTRQVWKWGRLRKMVPADADPWGHIPAAVRSNPGRKVFVSEEDARRLLDACPSARWRAVVALARWGGLRVVSELVPLTWADVHWPDAAAADERDRAGWLNVRSPKTEHHPGGERRTVPLFPELVEPLADLYELAGEGEERLFPGMTPKTNLGTTLGKIIDRAGVGPLPKPFTNLRASRATDLRHRHPGHLVTRWLGHSEAVEQEFYLTERPGDFTAAVSNTGNAEYFPGGGNVDSNARATRNPTRSPSAGRGPVRPSPAENLREKGKRPSPAEADRPRPLPGGRQESPTRTRTLTSRTKICGATITPSGNGTRRPAADSAAGRGRER